MDITTFGIAWLIAVPPACLYVAWKLGGEEGPGEIEARAKMMAERERREATRSRHTYREKP